MKPLFSTDLKDISDVISDPLQTMEKFVARRGKLAKINDGRNASTEERLNRLRAFYSYNRDFQEALLLAIYNLQQVDLLGESSSHTDKSFIRSTVFLLRALTSTKVEQREVDESSFKIFEALCEVIDKNDYLLQCAEHVIHMTVTLPFEEMNKKGIVALARQLQQVKGLLKAKMKGE